MLPRNSPFFGELPECLALLEVDAPKGAQLAALEAQATAWPRSAIGVSRRFFERHLQSARMVAPSALKPLRFHGDSREPADEGDLLLAFAGDWEETLCAALEARRDLERLGFSVVAAHAGNRQGTDRDHTGFIDGTSNLQELSPFELSRCTTIQLGDGDDRYAGASYVLIRKYEEDLRMWTTLSDNVQEQLVGRRKSDGAFLDGATDWSPSTWRATPRHAHVRCVNPRVHAPDKWRERVYRRSISYQEQGSDGELHSGILFIAVSRNPEEQVLRIHNTRLLPTDGKPDLFLSSGYVTPLRTASYLIPLRSSALEAELLLEGSAR